MQVEISFEERINESHAADRGSIILGAGTDSSSSRLGAICSRLLTVSLASAFGFHPPNSNDHLPPAASSSTLLKFSDVFDRLSIPPSDLRNFFAAVPRPSSWKSKMERSGRRHRSLDRSERRDCEIIWRVLVKYGSKERTMDSYDNGGRCAGCHYVATSLWNLENG